MLLRQLPDDSATARAQHGDDHAWGLQEQLLAATVDMLGVIAYLLTDGKGERPKPIPRPGIVQPDTSIGSGPLPLDELHEFFERTRRRR